MKAIIELRVPEVRICQYSSRNNLRFRVINYLDKPSGSEKIILEPNDNKGNILALSENLDSFCKDADVTLVSSVTKLFEVKLSGYTFFSVLRRFGGFPLEIAEGAIRWCFTVSTLDTLTSLLKSLDREGIRYRVIEVSERGLCG